MFRHSQGGRNFRADTVSLGVTGRTDIKRPDTTEGIVGMARRSSPLLI